jgi:NhaA family Na+:H+ antiporter
LKSGIHPTIAGVILGLLVPVAPRFEPSEAIPYARQLLEKLRLALQGGQRETAEVTLSELQSLIQDTESPAERLEKRLHRWVSFVILPVFALVNAGIVISPGDLRAAIFAPPALGIFLGLTVGKLAGVAGFSFLAVKLRLAPMPKGTHGRHLVGVGMLTGIGFTIALFVSGLAFETENLESIAKMAILAASLVAGVLGYTYLRLVYRRASA